MSERVPEGWSPALFGDLAKVVNGFAFKSSDFVEKSETSVPIIRMSSLKAGSIDLTDAVYVAEEKTKGLEKFLLSEGDFVFGMSGSISNFAIIKEQDGVCYQNQRVGRLSTINASSEFVSQLFLSEGVTRQIEGLAAGGAQLNISSSQIENLKILTPPLPEQKKIASILTSVDEVIETTQKQIDKLQDLKKATMNELLTKGIGHTEFKDSELGRIPKSWEVKSLGDFVKLQGGNAFQSSEFQDFGIPVIRISNIKNGTVSLDDCVYFADSKNLQKFEVKNGDILLAMSGATTGKIGIYKSKNKAYLNQRVGRFKILDCRRVEKAFLHYLVQSDIFSDATLRDAIGGAQPNISSAQVEGISYAFPTTYEQKEIAKTLESIDKKMQINQQKLSQTQSLKKSLMQDLLTGKVRVQVN